jgi:hypothetical protein
MPAKKRKKPDVLVLTEGRADVLLQAVTGLRSRVLKEWQLASQNPNPTARERYELQEQERTHSTVTQLGVELIAYLKKVRAS